MTCRIKRETYNLINLDERLWTFITYLLVVFGIFYAFRGSLTSLHPDLLLLYLFSFIGLGILLTIESISIDKTLQCVIIKKYYDLKYIPFQEIKEIRIGRNFEIDETGILAFKSWSIFLSSIDGKSIKIYTTGSHSDLEMKIKKISKIIDKKIPMYNPKTYSWLHDFESIRKDIEFVYRS